jgi:nitrite reductase (NO-forming)
MAVTLVAIAMSSAAVAQAQEITEPLALNEMQPAEIRIVSTEFKFVPAMVSVPAGRPVTLVLDNSGAETEHGIVLPAFNFRLDVKASEIAQRTFIFARPGEYEFSCDLPGHREAGMEGTLIVSAY